jgi:tRNA (guanine37-N1)-methyltransferase
LNKPEQGDAALPLRISFLTLFPESIRPFLDSSILKRAQAADKVSFNILSIRDFAQDRHKTVDHYPYGGGEGQVLRVDVLHRAWKAARSGSQNTKTVFLSPQGKRFDQEKARELSREKHLILVCGHYEGVDERFIDLCADEELSIGDYVLTGGEVAACVVADAITRLVPGVVGNPDSLSEDSLEKGLLKHPQYTRPPEYEGLKVPEVLLSGNHGKIERWRQEQRLERTQNKRPDLWRKKWE